MDITLTLSGLLVGILVGMTGVGGASLLTPLLLYLGIHPVTAIGTDLVYNSVTKLVGTIQHVRQRTVRYPIVLWMAFGSIPGAVLAVQLIDWVQTVYQHADELVVHLIAIVLIGASTLSIWTEATKRKKRDKDTPIHSQTSAKKYALLVTGFVLGFVVGLSSIGSGSLFALVIYYFYTLSGKELVGTDLFHGFLLSSVAGMLHMGLGNVEFPLLLQLLAGSIPGVLIGSRLTVHVSTTLLRYIVFATILVSGILLVL